LELTSCVNSDGWGRRESSSALFRTRLRWLLISLVAVVAGMLAFFGTPSSSFDYPTSLFRVAIFSSLPLVTLEWFYGYSGMVRMGKFVLLFSIGILATVGSAVHTTILMAAGPCAEGVPGGGFPLPWYLTFILRTGWAPPHLAHSSLTVPGASSLWSLFSLTLSSTRLLP